MCEIASYPIGQSLNLILYSRFDQFLKKIKSSLILVKCFKKHQIINFDHLPRVNTVCLNKKYKDLIWTKLITSHNSLLFFKWCKVISNMFLQYLSRMSRHNWEVCFPSKQLAGFPKCNSEEKNRNFSFLLSTIQIDNCSGRLIKICKFKVAWVGWNINEMKNRSCLLFDLDVSP